MHFHRILPGNVRFRIAAAHRGVFRTAIRAALLIGFCYVAIGCGQHPLTDYRALVNAGMSSATIEQLKKLNTADAEIARIVSLKQAGISDETCLALVTNSHQHQGAFTNPNAVTGLSGAGFSEPQILQIAYSGRLDTLSGDAVNLRLIGVSDSTVQTLLDRYMKGQPTLSTAEIARLKNVGLTEREILERNNRGMTDAQAEKEVIARENARNHYGTGFVRIHARRAR